MPDQLKPEAPVRSATDVGAGDYVKVNGQWKPIASNSAEGSERTPRNWTVRTEDGASYDMYSISRYAKAADLE